MKTTGYLAHNEWINFTELHVQTGDKIYECIANGTPTKIKSLIRGLDKTDREMVHYYFLDKHCFGWESKVKEMVTDWNELIKCGFA
jgi:hypothetical protein